MHFQFDLDKRQQFGRSCLYYITLIVDWQGQAKEKKLDNIKAKSANS